jgi:hypothetical protein
LNIDFSYGCWNLILLGLILRKITCDGKGLE